ncbi:MAG: LacI family DNA-binding transcriptional regulator [Mycobacteriales bacterium]
MVDAKTRATVRVIAEDTGVSIATVSRVLNNHDNVAPRTRELVLEAVERRRADARRASGPARSARGAVYVRCPYVLTDYFGIIVSSIAETLALHGRRVVLNAGEAIQSAHVLGALPDDDGISGALLILPPEPEQELISLRRSGFPFVVVDPRTLVPRNIAAVSAAHFSGARALTAHLVELGHRRIGVIGGPDGWLASDARLAGHRAAMAEVGVLPAREIVRDVAATAEAGYAAAGELLDLPDRPTALVSFNDKIAVGALRAALERGLRVPDDLSITGFDDIDVSRATQPQLTTVRQPLQEMGRMAVTLLMRLLDGHEGESLHIELATELVVRDSTGPAPS